jgi:DNA-binding transcriptional LysR family regulator
MHSMDWDDLRYFLAVYRSGSTSGAARALSVQHTTVGRRLAALEDRLGASLFTRTPSGLIPTTAAAEILPLAESAERSMRDIERAVAGRDGRLEGVVRLTTSDAFSGFFVRRLTALHAEHPGLVVEILSANRTFDLTRGEADLAVRMVPTTQPDLICRQVATVGWSLFASESYISRRGPLASAAELGGHELIGYDESLAGTPGARWLAEHARAARIVMRGNSIGAVINAAIVGIGIALVPCYLVAGEPTIRRLVPGLLLEREVWLVFHPDAGRIARVRRVIDFVTEVLEAERRVLRGAAN